MENRHVYIGTIIGVTCCRFLLAIVFIFSGFIKANDPIGTVYKIQDYLEAWHISQFIPNGIPYLGAIIMAVFEFALGFYLLFGLHRKITPILLLLFMGCMTPLTLWLAITAPISDCGCFGDALVISNTVTFWKNVVITLALCFLLWKNATVRSLYGPAVQWLTVVFPVVYLLVIMAVGFYEQPLIDFRPYKAGTYIIGDNEGGLDAEYSFIYEKNGHRQRFSLYDLPDTTWTFVNREESVPDSVAGDGKVVNQLVFFDGDYDVASEVLPLEGDVVLLLIPDLASVNVSSTFMINEMYDSLSESGIMMICLIGGSDSDIDEWREISMADYPVYKMDDTMVKTIARGNPALVRVSDGRIIWKQAMEAVNADDVQSVEDPAGDAMRFLIGLSVFLLLVMTALLVVNRTLLLIKFTIRLKKNRKKK